MHCDVTSCVICISNNVGYLEKEESYKNSTKKLHCHFKLSLQCNQKTFDNISLRRHFKSYDILKVLAYVKGIAIMYCSILRFSSCDQHQIILSTPFTIL